MVVRIAITVMDDIFISISFSSKRRNYALPPLDGSGNSRTWQNDSAWTNSWF